MLLRFDEPARFLARLADHDETETFAVLRIAEHLVTRSRPDAWLALDVEGEDVVGMAAWTPPWPLTVPHWPLARVYELLDAARAHAERTTTELASVVTSPEIADAIVPLHRTPARRLGLVFHVLTDMVPPAAGPGARRFATEDDVPLLADWLPRFLHEVKLPLHGDPHETARSFVRDGRMHLWIEDGRPIACAAHLDFGRVSTHLGMVYTPPELRGSGRASRLVGAVSRHALDRGRRQLTLYTDENNPTSNGIYRRLGYVERYRHVELGFER